MALHQLASVTIGVPNVVETARYYEAFGLSREGEWLCTSDGGSQLRLVERPVRRLVELCVGADDDDDIARIRRQLEALGVACDPAPHRVAAVECHSGVRVAVAVTDRVVQPARPTVAHNAPGVVVRCDHRSPAVGRDAPVQVRKLGHVVIGTPAREATQRFFTDGIGFKVSDEVRETAAFLRCSTDHHNLLVQAAPVAFMHHTSWQVDDVDEIGRGATSMLEGHPERHVWGLGRHFLGSNFFWYLRDPAGNFSEYYSDMDAILDDQVWVPGTWEPSLRALYEWGPDVPASMIEPEDLAELMAGAHRA